MKRSADLISRNAVFLWIVSATGVVLLVPAIASQFTADVQWSATDYVLMGLLLFGTASLFVLVARKTPRTNRLVLGTVFAGIFLYVWAELAVGVFTHLGS